MKLSFFCVGMVLLPCLASCIKTANKTASQTNKCGDAQATAITVATYSDWKKFKTPITVGDVIYHVNYKENINGSHLSRMNLITEVDVLCLSEPPLINSIVTLKQVDTSIHNRVVIFEDTNQLVIPESFSGATSSHSDYYAWHNTTNPDTIVVVNSISFPWLGGWSYDSAFIFSRLDQWSLSINYKLPK
ncbi:hypothetical protein [Puia dinghuensis]|uniref:Uncharacterized protein n=1 Tax=Puia dinghuensis TaxID=1792502 RepID=A0A8J2XWC8_9BACT|nr:hypothetical protein [Puia dinghuensis]GGB18773.1 hypothetical protein GCM10011511_48220 [Puia dinghuensis]